MPYPPSSSSSARPRAATSSAATATSTPAKSSQISSPYIHISDCYTGGRPPPQPSSQATRSGTSGPKSRCAVNVNVNESFVHSKSTFQTDDDDGEDDDDNVFEDSSPPSHPGTLRAENFNSSKNLHFQELREWPTRCLSSMTKPN